MQLCAGWRSVGRSQNMKSDRVGQFKAVGGLGKVGRKGTQQCLGRENGIPKDGASQADSA